MDPVGGGGSLGWGYILLLYVCIIIFIVILVGYFLSFYADAEVDNLYWECTNGGTFRVHVLYVANWAKHMVTLHEWRLGLKLQDDVPYC